MNTKKIILIIFAIVFSIAFISLISLGIPETKKEYFGWYD